MIRLLLLILLFLASLLTVFKAPAYYLWLLAIAVSEFPLPFTGITVLVLTAGFWIHKCQLAAAIIGIITLVLFLSPVVRAYMVASTLKQGLAASFGGAANNEHVPLSFSKLFSRFPQDTSYKTLIYDGSLSLDFYPSKISGKRPCVIVVHGGSWSSGDSKQLPELNTYLAGKGYNVASINYHLAPKFQAPVAIDDVKQAFSFLREHAIELQIDTNNFVLLGRSAGAQIALLAAYTHPELGLKGVIDFYGPADMVWGYSKPASKLVMDSRGVMERYLGGTYEAVPQKYAASSPIEFVNQQTVPTLVIHGKNDVLVAPEHSHRLNKKLQQNGIRHFYLKLPWATHGFDYNINGPGGQLSTYAVDWFLKRVTL
jgi:acetyl esterase/lipase